MEKKRIALVLLAMVSAGFCGCTAGGENQKQSTAITETLQESEKAATEKEQDTDNSGIENQAETVRFEEYSGFWSCQGKTHEQILSEGGAELSCTVTKDNQFAGTFYVQQERMGRFATVCDIKGKIDQAELYFAYSDDEWGNSGTLHLQFLSDSIYVEVLDYKEAKGGSDYGINGAYELVRSKEEPDKDKEDEAYPAYDSSWTEEEIMNAINGRSQYYLASAYYPEITNYWENVREVRDITNLTEPLFETDQRYYTKEEFENEPALVIHLAKNEIYARHGYIFKDEDLFYYFMGCIWYSPTCESKDFKDSVLNEYEKANLEILAELDVY
ncbi:YARHG domain-containing protein [Parablautia muri]|uniref:YARHG domain-containing protein n=1 Tax=Parablautia muri TaxID=2320879 RepID=A0A9X5BDY2_9FIRM|nr:YARHG domain-containing protein [Parablautia muri]